MSSRRITLVAVLLLLATVAVGWQVADVRDARAAEAVRDRVVDDVVTDRVAPGDYDGDGLRDDADVCPTRPETDNGIQDDDGCPEVVATTGAS